MTVSRTEAPFGRILLVEDDPVIRRVEEVHLRKAGHEVIAVGLGEEGLAMARAQLPDLVLVDHQLPDLMGTEVLHALQAEEVTRLIPVIMVTAEASPKVAEEYFDLGAVDYIRKPFAPGELRARVASTLVAKFTRQSLEEWKQAVSRDLELAGLLQRTLAAVPPLVDPRVRISTSYQPSLHVGGDFLHVESRSPDESLVCVGDVAGHGVASAMVSSLLKSILVQEIDREAAGSLAGLANALHAGLRSKIEDASVYATVLLTHLDHRTGQCRILRCGHPVPCLHPPDEGTSRALIAAGGPPVGFPSFRDPPFHDGQEVGFVLGEGASLLVHTDGIEEARHRDSGGELGPGGLASLWSDIAPMASRMHIPRLLQRLEEKGHQLEDDCSLVGITRIDPRSVIFEGEAEADGAGIGTLLSDAMEGFRIHGLDEELGTRAELLLAEHFANVLKHGEPATGSRLGLQVREIDGDLELLCTDAGREWAGGSTRKEEEMPADPLAESGRGLAIIRQLSGFQERHRRHHDNTTLYVMSAASRPAVCKTA